MIKIAPSILASDFSRLDEEIKKIDKAGADLIHIDIMDGHFVPNISFGPPVVKALRLSTGLPFDVHLMIEKPDLFIDSFIDAGADIITVHAEACAHLNRTINYIKKKGKKAGVALNPATSLSTLDWILQDIDMVLIMTVNPGFGGQMFLDLMTEKVEQLRETIIKKGLKIDIEVDGGIDLTNIGRITKAGANVIVAGTSVFKATNTEKIIKELKNNEYSNNL